MKIRKLMKKAMFTNDELRDILMKLSKEELVSRLLSSEEKTGVRVKERVDIEEKIVSIASELIALTRKDYCDY